MAHEFNIKNGFISNDNSRVIGGFTATTISASTYYGVSWDGGNVTNTAYFLQGLSGTSISANTYYGDGAGLSGVIAEFNGGTVSGNTIFTSGLTANTLNVTGNTNLSTLIATTISGVTTLRSSTISATTYQNLPVSGLTSGTNISVTGANGNFTITFTGTTGSNFTGGTVSGNTIYTAGLTANTLNITGLTSGTIISSLGVDSTGRVITGQTTSNFTGGTVTGDTIYTAGLSANTLNVSGSSIFSGGLSGTSLSANTIYMSSYGGPVSTKIVGYDQATGKLVEGAASGVNITGATYTASTGEMTFKSQNGSNPDFTVSGFTVYTDRRTYYSYPYQYSGSAPRGSAEGDSVWIIRRITFSGETPEIYQKVGTWTDKENPSGYLPY